MLQFTNEIVVTSQASRYPGKVEIINAVMQRQSCIKNFIFPLDSGWYCNFDYIIKHSLVKQGTSLLQLIIHDAEVADSV